MATTKTPAKPRAAAKDTPVTDVKVFARIEWEQDIETLYGDLGVNAATWPALLDTMFPAIKDPVAIRLALAYAMARKFDPFKVKIHIVPFWDKDEKRNRLVIMNSISDLRATAFRTGEYVGKKETRWGPTVEISLQQGTWKKHLPQSCQITIQRLVAGKVCDFEGPVIFFEEAYATASHNSELPNAIWNKRSIGMLEKCAEAAAIRVAFPEETGALKIAEEMAHEVAEDQRAAEATDITAKATEVEVVPEQPEQPVDDLDPFELVDNDGEVNVGLSASDFAALFCNTADNLTDDALIKGLAESNADEVNRLNEIGREDLFKAVRDSVESGIRRVRGEREAKVKADAEAKTPPPDPEPPKDDDLAARVTLALNEAATVEAIDLQWRGFVNEDLKGQPDTVVVPCRGVYAKRRQILVNEGKLR